MAAGEVKHAFYEPQLDGLRGLMAVWVLVWHASALSAYFTRLIPGGGVAVDVFMFLSGLLMTRNFAVREPKEPLASWNTIKHFWIRRLFRIAPLYYPALAISLYVSSEYRPLLLRLGAIFSAPWDSSGTDPSQHALTAGNILSHLSFTFGLFPQFASNNLLPDWSLSLEMQFYLVLPFVLIISRRVGLTIITVASTIVMMTAITYIGLYLSPGPLGLWPQPAMLAFKTNCFLAGILLGSYQQRRDLTTLTLFFATAFFLQHVLFTFFAVMSFVMSNIEPETTLGRAGLLMKKIFSNKTARFFGDISYSVYLLHMLILYGMFWILTQQTSFYVTLPAVQRFIILFGCTAVVIVPLAYGTYRMIELPGIELGRRLSRRKAATVQPQELSKGEASVDYMTS